MSAIDKAAGTCCLVDLSALRANLGTVRRLVGAGVDILAVVKADAYGHGDVETARVLCREGVRRLGVATVAEGARLRDSSVTAAIVVLGSPYPGDAADLLRRMFGPAPRISVDGKRLDDDATGDDEGSAMCTVGVSYFSGTCDMCQGALFSIIAGDYET